MTEYYRDYLFKVIDEIGLRVEEISSVNGLQPVLDEYVGLIKDYMEREERVMFIHTKEYF